MDNNNTNTKQALVDKLKESKNILVTVSSNPSVDQLAACLGLTLWLNKADKHATAVFSGDVPSTLEFLEPAETLEKNTDSLRDFIIALDKSKADKLRYKVEDKVVKIFITPYRTSLTADDLEFSQGDFNVDMVIALGVSSQADLDTAITAHGRILHDATVVTITTGEAASELGAISWHEPQTSSLSELVVDLGNTVAQTQLDGQIATALLTGVVAETERFSNDKTTPQTMSISAQLMSAGANQQLVASKLDEPAPTPVDVPIAPIEDTPVPNEKPAEDGTIEIAHVPGEEEPAEVSPEADLELPEPAPEAPAEEVTASEEPEIADVKQTAPHEEPQPEPAAPEAPAQEQPSRFVTEPPTMGGTLTANSRPDDIMREPTSDPFSAPQDVSSDLLDHDAPGTSSAPVDAPVPEPTAETMQPAPPTWMPPQPWMTPAPAATATEPAPEAPFTPVTGETLAEIEQAVESPHLDQPDLDSARDEVLRAIGGSPDANPEPIQALNAQPIDLNPPQEEATDMPAPPAAEPSTLFDPAAFGIENDDDALPLPAPTVDPELTGEVEQPYTLPLPNSLTPPAANPVPPTSVVDDPTAPPPVPPPLPFTPPQQ